MYFFLFITLFLVKIMNVLNQKGELNISPCVYIQILDLHFYKIIHVIFTCGDII